MIRLKVAMWMVLVLALALVIVWLVQRTMCDFALKAQSQQSARNLASTIATFANEDIRDRNYNDLQDYCDHLVRNDPIAFIAVVDAGGRVVVHTNRDFLGKKSEEIVQAAGVSEASIPVMYLTKRLGTVAVGVRTR
jgi:sensor histidine kinase regulating citrate/malate metabolism